MSAMLLMAYVRRRSSARRLRWGVHLGTIPYFFEVFHAHTAAVGCASPLTCVKVLLFTFQNLTCSKNYQKFLLSRDPVGEGVFLGLASLML